MSQNPENSNVYISAYSLLNAVGGTTEQVVTSVQAGISAYAQVEDENTGEVLTAGFFPKDLLPEVTEDMEEDLGLEEHVWQLLKLAKPCIREFVQGLPEDFPPVPLLVLTPDWNKNVSAEDYEDFAKVLVKYAGVEKKFSRVKELCGGRSAGLHALNYAVNMIKSNRMDLIAIGSVDTFSYEDYLVDMQDRLLGEEVMDGFIPGEGSAFMLLASKKSVEKYALDQAVIIKSIASSNEEGHLNSDKPYRGDGLSKAIGQVFDNEQRRTSTVFCSMNGEGVWAKEWGVGFLRNSDNFDENVDMNHPAESYGDIGVATGLTLTALAAETIKQRGMVTPVLVWCSDDYAPRYAMLLENSNEQQDTTT